CRCWSALVSPISTSTASDTRSARYWPRTERTPPQSGTSWGTTVPRSRWTNTSIQTRMYAAAPCPVSPAGCRVGDGDRLGISWGSTAPREGQTQVPRRTTNRTMTAFPVIESIHKHGLYLTTNPEVGGSNPPGRASAKPRRNGVCGGAFLLPDGAVG